MKVQLLPYGVLMSDNPVSNEHYVPRMHIYQFTENRVLDEKHRPTTPVTVKIRGEGEFKTKNLDYICSIVNFYDDIGQPGSELIENILAGVESYFNKALECIRNGIVKYEDGPVVRLYVALLYSRSIGFRNHIRVAMDELGLKDSDKRIHTLFIASGLDKIGRYPLDEYIPVIVTDSNANYITSDEPVVQVNSFEIIKELCGIDESQERSRLRSEYDKENVYICPISSISCVCLYHKDSINSARLIKEYGIFTEGNINRLMCYYAGECIFYARPIDAALIELFESNKDHLSAFQSTLKYERQRGKSIKKQK